jgi:hypothetical protein
MNQQSVPVSIGCRGDVRYIRSNFRIAIYDSRNFTPSHFLTPCFPLSGFVSEVIMPNPSLGKQHINQQQMRSHEMLVRG